MDFNYEEFLGKSVPIAEKNVVSKTTISENVVIRPLEMWSGTMALPLTFDVL
jgi:hypothetical protein